MFIINAFYMARRTSVNQQLKIIRIVDGVYEGNINKWRVVATKKPGVKPGLNLLKTYEDYADNISIGMPLSG